jgi:hypothetical protein
MGAQIFERISLENTGRSRTMTKRKDLEACAGLSDFGAQEPYAKKIHLLLLYN